MSHKKHLIDLGRLKRIARISVCGVVAVADDVDPFAPQLVDDVLDSVAAHADASSHAIDPLVGTADGHLAAITRLAGHSADLDHAVGDFREFPARTAAGPIAA